MAYVVAATYRVKAGEEEKIREILETMTPFSRAEPGCLYYQTHRSADDPQVFFLYEQYADEAAYQTHMSTPHFERYIKGEAVPRLEKRMRVLPHPENLACGIRGRQNGLASPSPEKMLQNRFDIRFSCLISGESSQSATLRMCSTPAGWQFFCSLRSVQASAGARSRACPRRSSTAPGPAGARWARRLRERQRRPDTWTWKDGCCTAPASRSASCAHGEQYTNFELVVEWRHLQARPATPASSSGRRRRRSRTSKPDALPHGGIEVQVLDHGYAEQYEKRTGKKADWFTTNGDVFPVGKSKMKPFPPVSPNGSAQLPAQEPEQGRRTSGTTTTSAAINGEVRLWVNGEEVSGGNDCEPRTGLPVPGVGRLAGRVQKHPDSLTALIPVSILFSRIKGASLLNGLAGLCLRDRELSSLSPEFNPASKALHPWTSLHPSVGPVRGGCPDGPARAPQCDPPCRLSSAGDCRRPEPAAQ